MSFSMPPGEPKCCQFKLSFSKVVFTTQYLKVKRDVASYNIFVGKKTNITTETVWYVTFFTLLYRQPETISTDNFYPPV